MKWFEWQVTITYLQVYICLYIEVGTAFFIYLFFSWSSDQTFFFFLSQKVETKNIWKNNNCRVVQKKPKITNLDEIKNGGDKNHRSWVALKIHRKRILLKNICSFHDRMINLLRNHLFFEVGKIAILFFKFCVFCVLLQVFSFP